jgi:hypothetical protein
MSPRRVSVSMVLGSLAFSAMFLASGKVFGLPFVIAAASILVLMALYLVRSPRRRAWRESFLFGALCADLFLMVIDFLLVEVFPDRGPELAPGSPLSVLWMRVALWSVLVAVLTAIDVSYQRSRAGALRTSEVSELRMD